ncbi:MAG TPA: branched-chain amino acid ABC transporter permease [Gaiellaceae bacterium]|nr:branched-chain amino acid ABC transporter permease [Gaiellaceae bacterium]
MTNVPPTEPAGPQIGADEWVARSADRSTAYDGLLGRIRRSYERVPKAGVFAFVVALAALLPIVVSHSQNDLYYTRVGTVALVFGLLALGLNVAVGFAGLLDLGYIAYYGVGAYGYAMLSSDKFGVHWQAWLVIPLVVLVSAVLGFLLALPSRRLVGDYLAIVTLFFGQIFYVLVTQGYRVSVLGLNKDLGLRPNWDVTGGPNGIANVDRFRLGGLTASSEHAYYYVTLVAVVVVFAALWLANRSRTGRAWRALHDDPLAAQAMSMPVNWLKLMAVGVGAAVAALAGTINAALLQGAFPDDYNTQVLIIIYAMVILGGAGSLPGAIAGAVVVEVLLTEGLRPQTPISDWTFNGRWVFYGGILLILLATIRPWRRLGAIVAGVIAFGVVVHLIVGAFSARATGGLLNTGPTEFGRGGWFGWLVRHWLVLPKDTYETGTRVPFNIALVVLIVLVLVLTLLHGWKRDVLLVPTIWLAGFVWETRLVLEASGPTRLLLLGVILIVVMIARPQGLFGRPRVEIV